jgi:hypothetical protein
MSTPSLTVLLLTFARRGEDAAIRRAITALLERVPGARVIAVGTPVSAPILRDLGIADILVYGDGKSARQVVEEAQLFMPGIAAIVYDHPRFAAHLKLEALALALGVRTVLRFPPPIPESQDPRPEAISRLRLALTVAAKGLHMLLRLCVGKAVTTLGRSQGGRGESRA